ncbi:PRC-barrel-like [Acididesulfobacillus acetoxydans]|uniref:PRC-barrel domain protein n=1 Tax=Acididesulfobacillus acetoxydans TaxID=1561005 RepID=A0A8S0VVP1_9FIRM|nr:PRC-barrel domain-containing protein [Acididesulfobacillus acetoxydans]CAA7599893.1 PRC-barrel-like [Acididesulfobacillus acetoxydans]CEJ08963.1 PRC-barrel domain protein [Acididesulfobacillus acetoxydans]
MKPSRKFLSLPIITLKEGQQIGYVKGLVLDAREKAVAALVVDPKGFFKDQRIIPYSKVVSVGDDAITIDKESHVEKSAGIPELLELLKEKLGIIGTKVVTESGKILGIAAEYYVDTVTGKVTQLEVSGGKIGSLLNGRALLSAEQLVTIGPDVIVAQKESELSLDVADKGLNDTLKSFLHSTSHLASEKTQTLSQYFRKGRLSDDGKPPEQAAANTLPAESGLFDHEAAEPETDTSEHSTPLTPADNRNPPKEPLG